MTDDSRLSILALVRDLIFSTKITTTARANGVEVKIVRDPVKLAGETGRLLLVDLNLDGAIEAAAAWQRAQMGKVVGFVSHVDAETTAAARAAGLRHVMARSRFVQVLPQLLAGEGPPATPE
jgi:hypothetical protein